MRRSKFLFPILALAVLVLTGCTHILEVKNLRQYRAKSSGQLGRPITMGIVTSVDDPDDLEVLRYVADGLRKEVSRVVMPYNPNMSNSPVDVIANINVTPEYKGSWANFFIEWPGFLIWTPAWNGYVYKANYEFDVNLSDYKTKQSLGRLSVPIKYNLRHADIGRTWTEISWLEVSLIAFVSGFFFTQYDEGITPDVIEKVGPRMGDYVAERILNELAQFQPAP